MTGDPIPPSDHVARYCPGSTIAPGGRVSGTAFRLRAGEEYLSVNWLEFFNLPSRAHQIAEVRRILDTKLTLGRTAKIAVLNVGEITNNVREQNPDGSEVSVRHEPLDDDPSHGGIFDVNSDLIADLIAEIISEAHPAMGT